MKDKSEIKQAVTRDIAEADFDRMVKAARIKWDLFRQFSGSRDADNDRALIVSDIMDGAITVDTEGFPTVYTNSDNEQLKEIKIFRRPTRGDKLMIDRCKDGHNVSAQDAVLGQFLKLAPALLQSLDDIDYKRIEVLWSLFLGY